MNSSCVSLLLAVSLGSSAVGAPLDIGPTPLSREYLCGRAWLEKSGAAAKHDAERVLRTIFRSIEIPDGVSPHEFALLTLSVIKAESGFRNDAVSHAGAVGIMQVTEVAAIHARSLCFQHIPLKDTPMMSDIAGNVKLGTCYLGYALRESGGDITGALIMYNGGIRALTSHRRGGKIPTESAHYAVRVLGNINSCVAGNRN